MCTRCWPLWGCPKRSAVKPWTRAVAEPRGNCFQVFSGDSGFRVRCSGVDLLRLLAGQPRQPVRPLGSLLCCARRALHLLRAVLVIWENLLPSALGPRSGTCR